MESTLHQQLKDRYAASDDQLEVRLGDYRIDVRADDELIEIQFSSLAAIRDKVRSLLTQHRVRVVKPIVARKHIVRLNRRDGKVVARRVSPKRGDALNIYDDLIYFTRVFPHRNLIIEAPLIEIEEIRYPARRRRADFTVQDRRLLNWIDVLRLRTSEDLLDLARADDLPDPFHTGHLAAQLNKPRWLAQRIAYCWRKMGAAEPVGKQGNAHLYRRVDPARRPKRKSG